MDETTIKRMQRKFDICYVMVKENMMMIHDLEVRHGVNLGYAYKTKDSAKNFTHYIAESQRHYFIDLLSKTHFYSFLMDGSTDAGKVEDELVVIMFCTKDRETERVRSCVRFFGVEVPEGRADADQLIHCLGRVLLKLLGGSPELLCKENVFDCKPGFSWWWNRWGICKHSRTEWDEGKVM